MKQKMRVFCSVPKHVANVCRDHWGSSRAAALWPLAAIGALAAILLLWGLDSKYLWQDEANTAVLAVRMLRYGRPLAYDGVNFVGREIEDVNSAGQRTISAKAAIDYYVRRGDLKPDTAWTWHPWGQFLIAGASIKLFGQTTLAARLPFALASIATVLALYQFVLTYSKSARMARIASVLLTFNAYWILHGRQCRYYSLSSLFLMLTLFAYVRWQSGGRWGAAAFVVAAWCWFQVDYGTVWPVLAILFADAFTARCRRPWNPFLVGVTLAGAMAPFIWYYELWGRFDTQTGTWGDRFFFNLFNLNQYVVPLPIVAASLAVLVWRRKSLGTTDRRAVVVACGIVVAMALWVPSVTIASFLRYSIMAAPVGCLLSAWLLVRAFPRDAAWLVWMAAAILALTPWLSLPLQALIGHPRWYTDRSILRGELTRLGREIFGHEEDPNREIIEWLRKNASPSDEILINYEDLPLMYYLPNPIRGGIETFRAEDDTRKPPDVLVLLPGAPFNWVIFAREVNRYKWRMMPLSYSPGIWGNNPDPETELPRFTEKATVLAGRRAY